MRRPLSRAEFDRAPVHAIGYQAGGSLETGYEEVIERVRTEGLSRGDLRGAPDRGPVLARLGADWERPGVRFLDEGDAYAVLDAEVRHRAGIDLSVGDRVPAERILAIFRARAGEPLFAAYLRAVSPSEPTPPTMDTPAR